MKACTLFGITVIFLFGILSPLRGQPTFERTYGGIYYDAGSSVLETADKGFIIVGTANSFSNDTNAAYVIRTNWIGDTLWTRIIGDVPSSASDIQYASDGGYVLAISASSVIPGSGTDMFLVKIDDTGNTIWSKSYGGPALDYIHSVAATADGGYALLAHTFSFGSGGADFYLVRVDQAGDTLWTKTYGGNEWDWGGTVQQTMDGGFIMVGDTKSFGDPNADLYLVKTDSSGALQWQKTYGGAKYDRGYFVIQVDDGGYMVAGTTESYGAGDYDCYILRTDANGDTLWTKTYGGTGGDAAQAVQQTSDSNFIFVGGITGLGPGRSDAYLVKIDPNGDKLWERLFGDTEFDWANHVMETADGRFAFVGFSESLLGSKEEDIYLVVTTGRGDITGVSEGTGRDHPKTFSLHANYPNPFNPGTNIRYELSNPGNMTLKIFDLLGREVRTLVDEYKPAGTFQVSWDGKDEDGREVSSGTYLYRLMAGNGFVQIRKLLLVQ